MTESPTTETAAPDVIELDSGEFSRKYKVIAKLGEGGMARAHLAVVRGVAGVRKLVVLKSVRPELVSDPKVCKMFLAEARLAVTFNHPNIVQTFEVIISKNRPLLVMEYMDGQPISRIVKQAGVPLSLPLFALGEILNGVDYAHKFTDIDGTKLNLVHRDISPQNIFVTYDGHVKLLDFGIAKIVGSTDRTETGEIKGKVRYMAPEQMLGSAEIDGRADIFSIGVILWEAVTGRRLWEGLSDIQVIQAVVQGGGVPAPSTIDPTVAPCLDAICKRALAHNSADRYESAAAMQTDIEAAIEELDLRTDSRQVGRFVSQAFAELRTSIKSVIETQLSNEKASPVSLTVSDEIDVLVTEEEAASSDLWGLPSVVSASAHVTNRERKRRRRGLVVGGFVVAGALASALWLGNVLGRGRESGVAAVGAVTDAPLTSAAVSPAASGDKAHASVRLSLEATPARARLFFDDEPLDGNPFHGNRPRDKEHHVLRVDAPGYRSRTIPVDLTGPVDTRIDLEPLDVAVSAKTAVVVRPLPGRVVAPVVTSSPALQLARSCSPPFIIDDNGIKSFKPECLK
jgi:serine/threonine-protein kinase